MSASLKTRVGRIVVGSVHALFDMLESQAPEAVMEQIARESDAVLADVRHELGLISANRHLAQQQHASLNAEHGKLGDQIAQALAANREDLARAAVARQLDIESQIPVIEETLGDYARQEVELQGYIQALLAKRREMDEAIAQFRRSRAAAASPASAPGQGGGAPGSGTAGVDRRMEAVTGDFDRVYARHAGLTSGTGATGLKDEAKLRELEDLARDNKIAERLARLRGGAA